MRFPGFEGEWKLINISEFLDFQNGINADSDKYGSGIKYISVSDILNNPYICYDEIKGLVDIDNSTLEHYKVEYGDIVFQRSTETFEDIGHANVYLDKSRPATFGGFVIRGKKKGNYNPFFFKNLLDTPYARKITTRMGAGAQHYNIGQDGLSKIALYFPKINEQEKIADLFMILNKKIQLQKELIESLKLYKRGLLAKLFPKNGGMVPQYRFEGFTDDWEQRKFGEVTNSYSGGTPAAGKSQYYDGDIPYIRSGEIYEDHTELFLTTAGLNSSSAKLVSEGDILYALYGATSGEVSRAKLAGAINQAVLAIKPNNGFDSEYMLHWLRFQRKNIVDTFLQGGQGNLSATIIKNLDYFFPISEEQIVIGDIFKKIDHLITLHQEKYSFYEKMKFALLQQMFI